MRPAQTTNYNTSTLPHLEACVNQTLDFMTRTAQQHRELQRVSDWHVLPHGLTAELCGKYPHLSALYGQCVVCGRSLCAFESVDSASPPSTPRTSETDAPNLRPNYIYTSARPNSSPSQWMDAPEPDNVESDTMDVSMYATSYPTHFCSPFEPVAGDASMPDPITLSEEATAAIKESCDSQAQAFDKYEHSSIDSIVETDKSNAATALYSANECDDIATTLKQTHDTQTPNDFLTHKIHASTPVYRSDARLLFPMVLVALHTNYARPYAAFCASCFDNVLPAHAD